MTHEDLLKEASDPATDPERLRELARHQDVDVQRAARKNPSLPEDICREALLRGEPEAWANPMAPLYVLTWTPRKNEMRTVEAGARLATWSLWETPERCSAEGKVLINNKIQEWWAICEWANDMIKFLGWWAKAKGKGSPEHRETMRILVLCVRTTPDLTDGDSQALDLFEAWSKGRNVRNKEAKTLAQSMPVKETIAFALDPRNASWAASAHYVIREVLQVIERKAGKEAKDEHERHLADLIRREMPLPPVVD
jgi:hypothetical protein